MIDWNKLATPAEITYENFMDALDYAYTRTADPRQVMRLVVKFGRGKGYAGIPPAQYSDFLAALGKLR
jgi:hypothetical protein